MQLFSRVILVFVGAVIAAGVFAGDDPIEKAIKARRAAMTLHSWYAGPLFMMAKGKIEYDAAAASTAAANLEMIVNSDGSAMWPQGSDNRAYPGKTRALAKAWSEYDPSHKEAMVTAAAAMAEAAGNGLDALRANIGAIGDACSSCHDATRAEDF